MIRISYKKSIQLFLVALSMDKGYKLELFHVLRAFVKRFFIDGDQVRLALAEHIF